MFPKNKYYFLWLAFLLIVPANALSEQSATNETAAEAPSSPLPLGQAPATEQTPADTEPSQSIFDDKQQLNGFAERYQQEPMGVIIAMVKDETLDPYRTAAAVRVFRENYYDQVFLRDKVILEKTLLRRLSRTDSPFLEVEIMHALCLLNRYKYFNSMVPALIQKLDHYNSTVDELAYESLMDLADKEHAKPREARIVFNSLRKMLFLSRRRLANVTEPSPQLKQKLELLRWAIKILGTEELNRLPREVLHLL